MTVAVISEYWFAIVDKKVEICARSYHGKTNHRCRKSDGGNEKAERQNDENDENDGNIKRNFVYLRHQVIKVTDYEIK